MAGSNEIEKCVICKQATCYTRNTPINERKHYVEGVGQLCEKCGEDIEHSTPSSC